MANNPRIFGLGSTYDVTALARFRGTNNKLVLQPDSEMDRSETGVRYLTRQWWCRADLVEAFEPRAGDQDYIHRTLKYWKHKVKYRGAGAMITSVFNGFIGNEPPTIVVDDDDLQQQEIQISGNTALVGGSGLTAAFDLTVVYLAPSISVSYAAREKPGNNEPFAAEPQGKCEIIETRGPDGIVITNTSKITRNLADFGVFPRLIRTKFSKKQEGEIFNCTETIQRLLVREVAAVLI
jgi:hypothetical protein